MICIFCLKERPSSIEHVFPDAIGGTLTIDRVCKPCNDYLGAKVDSLLTDHILILMKRDMLQIKNRDGKVVGTEKILGVGTLVDNPAQRVKLVPVEGQPGLQPQLLFRSERLITPDGSEVVQISIDGVQSGEIGKIIERTRKREGLPQLSPEALKTAVAKAQAQARSVERPQIRHDMKIDVLKYRVAVLKIAYELAWLWLGDAYLDDPEAALLRAKIFEESETDIEANIQLGMVPPFNQWWLDEPNAMIGYVAQEGQRTSIAVRFFDAISGVVTVSQDQSRYPAFEKRFFACDPVAVTQRASTMDEEIARIAIALTSSGLDAATGGS